MTDQRAVVEVGELDENEQFVTLLTHRMGKVMNLGVTDRSNSDCVTVKLFSPEETRRLHRKVKVLPC
jgi:hypothetical protein